MVSITWLRPQSFPHPWATTIATAFLCAPVSPRPHQVCSQHSGSWGSAETTCQVLFFLSHEPAEYCAQALDCGFSRLLEPKTKCQAHLLVLLLDRSLTNTGFQVTLWWLQRDGESGRWEKQGWQAGLLCTGSPAAALVATAPSRSPPSDLLTFTFCWTVLLLLFVSESLGTLLSFYYCKRSYFKWYMCFPTCNFPIDEHLEGLLLQSLALGAQCIVGTQQTGEWKLPFCWTFLHGFQTFHHSSCHPTPC